MSYCRRKCHELPGGLEPMPRLPGTGVMRRTGGLDHAGVVS